MWTIFERSHILLSIGIIYNPIYDELKTHASIISLAIRYCLIDCTCLMFHVEIPIMIWLICVVILCVVLTFVSLRISPTSVDIDGKHVMITGGSSGIGKAVAVLAVQRGASVTIIARNKLKLEETKTELQKSVRANRKVHCVSVDLSSDFELVSKAVCEAEEKLGPVFMLVNSAGMAVSGSIQDIDPAVFKQQMEANYLSAAHATKAVISSMVRQQGGRIVLLSSQAGQIGLFGFTAYSASKFALRGFAEALQMEMTPHNIRVTVAFPPDTDTPGFKQELEGKPKETLLISETAGLLKPEDVARTILKDSLNGKFVSYFGLDGWLLAMGGAGMSPATSLGEVILQFLLMGLLRVIGLFYLASFDSIILKCKREKEGEKLKSS